MSKERRANLKDLLKLENLEPIPVEEDDDALPPSSGLFSIASKSMTTKIIIRHLTGEKKMEGEAEACSSHAVQVFEAKM